MCTIHVPYLRQDLRSPTSKRNTKAAISTLLVSSGSLLLLENLEQTIKKIGHRLTVNLGAQMTVLYTRYN